MIKHLPRDFSDVEAIFHHSTGCDCEPCTYMEGRQMEMNVRDTIVFFANDSRVRFEFTGLELKQYGAGMMIHRLVNHIREHMEKQYPTYELALEAAKNKFRREKPEILAAYAGAPMKIQD